MTDRAASPPSDNGQQPPAPSTRPALTTSKPAPTSTPTPPTNHPLLAVARHSGHQLPFVTPSTYLHQRASTATATPNNLASAAAPHVSSHSRTIPPPALILAPETPPPMTPLDRDQVQGLVSRTTPRLLCWISDLWTETLSPSSSLPPHTCAVRRKGSTILPASLAASPTSASQSLLTCLVRRTSCAVHMGAGYPLGRVTAHESRGCDISESWRVLGPFWMVARRRECKDAQQEAVCASCLTDGISRRPYASSSRFEPATMSCRYPSDLSCSTMTLPFEPV